MRHIRQAVNMCVPTSLAMVCDCDPDHVIGAVAGPYCQWDTRSYAGHIRLAFQYFAPWALSALDRYLERNPGDDKPPVKGRGLILCSYGWHGHAVAFENGKVYNPDESGPRCIRAWWADQQERHARLYIAKQNGGLK